MLLIKSFAPFAFCRSATFFAIAAMLTVPALYRPGLAGRLAAQEDPALPAKLALPPTTPQAWTLDEAMQRLRLNPRDPYLQYVAYRLAYMAGEHEKIGPQIDQLRGEPARMQGTERQSDVDLFSAFTGALAVQESLQLDAMRDRGPASKDASATIALSELQGPTTKSHPWKEMLGDKQPAVSQIAKWIPADQFLVQSKSLAKLVELLEYGDLWGTHINNQAWQNATTSRVDQRLREQLAVRADPLTRPFYDLVVEEVAVTGSDLYFREGSDVTLVFRVKQPKPFQARMDAFLAEAEEQHPSAKRSTGSLLGVNYVHLATPDRRVHVFSAYPDENVHVRSNSIVGLERVLRAMREPESLSVARLGETDEFRYIRTLMPEEAEEEDVFIYLSDPFIRHMVGPKLKLTERRRLLAYNHLRMLGHATTLFRTQYGRDPKSLDELIKSRCAPESAAHMDAYCDLSGELEPLPDSPIWLCSNVGNVRDLVPNCEIPLDRVTQREAEQYREFVERYNQYWRTFFDPIAIRVQMSPGRYRVETIVLPLIDNSFYTGLSEALSGKPTELEPLPAPRSNIFTLAFALPKEAIAKQADLDDPDLEKLAEMLGQLDAKQTKALVEKGKKLWSEGIGDTVGIHICDADPMFELAFLRFAGRSIGSFRRGGESLDIWIVTWLPLIASIQSPVYVSVPVRDGATVDAFLEALDPLLAAKTRESSQNGFIEIDTDFYTLDQFDFGKVRAVSLGLGPIKWRFFYARIGDGLYFASRRHVLEEIAEAKSSDRDPRSHAGTTGHAMLRARPENWNKVLDDFQLGWAESTRRAVLGNLGRLSSVARAHVAMHPEALKLSPNEAAKRVLQEAADVYGCEFISPDGGEYLLSDDGRSIIHSLYGSELAPRQGPQLAEDGQLARLIRQFAGATVTLTFLEDGLHAVLTVDRK